jgi:hypothetical protein
LAARPRTVSTAFMDSMANLNICRLCRFWRESIAPARVDLDAVTLVLRGPPEVENLTWAQAPSLKRIPEN